MVDRAQTIEVVIASPSDLEAERRAIPNLFVQWNRANRGIHLTPVMWETSSVPAYGDHPQHILDDQMIERADLLVALFWSKIGSPTPSASSGTIEEIREFIRRKGPKRVMVYFCTRHVAQSPDEIDPTAIALIKEFKTEIRSQCLYREFRETAEFEKYLYQHLDIKTDELLRGFLPTPEEQEAGETEHVWWNKDAGDERLQRPVDFGSSIADIATRFAARMDEFDREDGATNNKFLNLGEHVYRSVARSIEHLLRTQPYDVDVRMRPQLADIILQLRQLADDSSQYLKRPFPEFWKRGRVISNSLKSTAQIK